MTLWASPDSYIDSDAVIQDLGEFIHKNRGGGIRKTLEMKRLTNLYLNALVHSISKWPVEDKQAVLTYMYNLSLEKWADLSFTLRINEFASQQIRGGGTLVSLLDIVIKQVTAQN